MSHVFRNSLFLVAMAWSGVACSQPQQTGAGDDPAATPAAASEPSGTPAGTPEVVRALEGQGLDVMGEFDAPGGLRAFAGIAGQRPVAVYLTPDGAHAIVGTLVDAQGNDVAAADLQRIVQGPMTEKAWAQLEDSAWVLDGNADAPRIVYTFTDANCPFCHRFWEAARPWVESGKVQLRHVMVGVISQDSPNKAAAILQAESPSEALAYNETNYNNGGIQPLATIPPEVGQQLTQNGQLMLELGFQGTPGIVYHDDAEMMQRHAGLPQPAELQKVLGAP